MLLTWDLTVPTATKRVLAISELVRPDASRVRTSRSLKGTSSRDARGAQDEYIHRGLPVDPRRSRFPFRYHAARSGSVLRCLQVPFAASRLVGADHETLLRTMVPLTIHDAFSRVVPRILHLSHLIVGNRTITSQRSRCGLHHDAQYYASIVFLTCAACQSFHLPLCPLGSIHDGVPADVQGFRRTTPTLSIQTDL
jgi:hypothetical protein